MSAQTDYRQILTGTEQANQAVAWDWFATNSTPIEGRVAPSGQTWGVLSGGENKVRSNGGTMHLTAGNEAATVYTYLVSPVNITVIGAEVQSVVAGGVTNYAGVVLLIAAGTNIGGSDAFLHFSFNPQGFISIDWYAAGLAGGITATTGNIGIGVVPNSQPITLQGLVSSNGTVTFVTSMGTCQLTGLTLPGDLTFGIFEFTNTGAASLRNAMQYRKVWLNPLSALMTQISVQPHSYILDRLASALQVTLTGLTLTASDGVTMATSARLRVSIHASWIGALEFMDSGGTTQSTMGMAADNQFYWALPANGNGITGYNGARNTQLFRFYDNGDIETSVVGAGFVMKSPNGSRWRLTVSNAGVLGATAL